MHRGKDEDIVRQVLWLLGDGTCIWIPTIHFLVPPPGDSILFPVP